MKRYVLVVRAGMDHCCYKSKVLEYPLFLYFSPFFLLLLFIYVFIYLCIYDLFIDALTLI